MVGIIDLAKNLNEWDIYNKWNSKIKTIETQRKNLVEQGILPMMKQPKWKD